MGECNNMKQNPAFSKSSFLACLKNEVSGYGRT